MTLLLDTHIVVWLTEDLPRLGKLANRACDAALSANEIAVSTVVFYELGRLVAKRRIAGPLTVVEWRRRLLTLGVREVPVSAEIMMEAAELQHMHLDPIDRMIVATALVEDAVLLTADRPLLAWSGNLRRQDARR